MLVVFTRGFMDNINTKRKCRIPSNAVVIPIMVLLTLFYAVIIALVYAENRSTNELSQMLEDSAAYRQEINDMQAGMSLMSETMTSFVLQPVVNDSLNVGPIMQYAIELPSQRRGTQIIARFRAYNVSDTVLDYLEIAAVECDNLIEMELHAFSLVVSVYPLPENEILQSIPTVELTAEELAMPAEARLGAARSIILGREYGQCKNHIIDSSSECNESLQADFSLAHEQSQSRISAYRIGLWIAILLHACISLLTVILFYRFLMAPLHNYAKRISQDEALDTNDILNEIALVANAYNGLLARRTKLESLLRTAAETDALTGMPNRYAMDSTLSHLCTGEGSMTVLLFDVNYLKKINDTMGHQEGDRVIQVAGKCILECFGVGYNCFRIGGDEFTAILRGCTEEDVKERLERFKQAQARENISVSVGYAYSETSTDEKTFKSLAREADKQMYLYKKQMYTDSRS